MAGLIIMTISVAVRYRMNRITVIYFMACFDFAMKLRFLIYANYYQQLSFEDALQNLSIIDYSDKPAFQHFRVILPEEKLS